MHTFSIEITDEMIERAIARSVTKTYYDDDGDPVGEPMHLSSMVKQAVSASIDHEVSKVVQAEVGTAVRDAVAKALADGFPTFDQWGTKTGMKTLRDLIGERCFPRERGQDGLVSMVRDEAQKTVKAMVAEAVKSAGGAIDKMFADAAAEGLGRLMASKLGIR